MPSGFADFTGQANLIERALAVPHRSSATYEKVCGELAGRLRERRREIEAAVHAQIREKAPVDQTDPSYIHGLHAAIREAIKFTLTAIETGEARAAPLPTTLLGQARLAARHGVTVATVLRRYTLGAHQISDLIVTEARQDPGLFDDHLQRLLREQGLLLERALLELEHEYARESFDRPDSHRARLATIVRRRLAGELVDLSALNYELDRHHIGLVTQSGCEQLLDELAHSIDGRLLRISPGGDSLWAWIGTQRPVDPEQFRSRLIAPRSSGVRLGLGEPGAGPIGWAQTHRQALEAFPYVLRQGSTAVRYADIAVQAAIERHDLAMLSLHQLYVAPLEQRRDGDVLLRTLRAYFAADRNGASAEAALEVSRQTVSKRLRTIETALKKPLAACGSDLELALRLHDFRD